MKAPRMTRILSFFLALVFCLYLVPTEVLAAELESASRISQSEYARDFVDEETPDVVSEIVSSRDEYQKEYILSNGQRLLTVYPTAVHYMDEEGMWQEIDNTLQTASLDGKRVYQNTAGIWEVTLPSSLSASEAVSIARGDSVLSFRFAGQLLQDDVLTAKLARMNEDITPSEGAEDPSDVTPPAEETPAVEEPSADEPQQDGEESAVEAFAALDTPTVDVGGNSGDTSVAEPAEGESTPKAPEDDNTPNQGETPATEEPKSEDTDEPQEPATPAGKDDKIGLVVDDQWETATTTKMGNTIFGRTPMQASQLSLKDSEITFSQKDKTLQQTFSEKLSSAAEYASVFNGVSVRYDLTSNTLKESVIIASAPANRAGYQYLLEVKNLVLELQEDNSIYAYAEDHAEGDEPLFVMPAPYLFDQERAYCDDIELILKETDNGYLLTYLLPQEWMAAEDRAYPVVLDPVVNAELSFTNIADQTVFSKTQLSYTWAMLCIGQGQYGIGRSFLKYKNLPALTSADVIVGAQMALYKIQTSSTSSEIDVHKVNGTWESNTINWSNKPSYDSTVEDYQIAGTKGWYYWDVTDIAQEWYTGDNTGMMFKMEDSQEAAATDLYREFCSSDYTADTLPFLSIAYINNCGLENIWDYTSHSAGAAGTGYVNDYTGNLVWVYSGLGFSGNRMPVSINHIYNANDKANNDFGMGYGWRSNYNQLVYRWSSNSSYYIWEDEDATRHYFKYKSSGTYEDEVNTGLILTTNGSGTTKYCITDKNNYKSYFDTSGRLTKISNNQATTSNITVTYSSGKRIASITDGAGRKYQFNYSGTALSGITFLGTGSSTLATETYTYSGNELTSITSSALSSASFSYTSNHLLSQVSDANGYKLTYAYNTTSSSQPNRVVRVREYDGSTTGGTLSISYAHNQNTFTDHNGNQEIMQFNNFGSTVSVQDSEGMAQFYRYADNSTVGKASQMVVSSKLQNTVVNQIYNSSFESSSGWTTSSGNASTGSWSYASSGYMGSKALMIKRTANSGSFGIQPTSSYYCTVEPGKTYTLSAYVKTSGMSGSGTGARLALMLSGATVATSEAITATKDWTRLEVTYTHPATASTASIIPCLQNGTSGTAYFDCVQFEKSANASRYNLIENGDFRYTSGWTNNSSCDSYDRRVSSSGTAAVEMNSYAYRVYGEATKDKRVSQTVNVSGSKGDVFSVAGWAKGDSVPMVEKSNRRFAILAHFNYTTTSSSDEADTLIAFNPGADSSVNWQYVADRIVAKKAYSSITISLLYSYNANVVYFDGIQLFKEEFGHSYVYDSNGNVTSVTDLQKKTTTYEYSNNNLTKMTLPSGASQKYTYDSYHNVLSATSPEGVVSNFTYDSYGNNTKVTVGSGTKKITSSATYTSNGDQLSTVTDALGQTTSYGYDTQTGVLNWTQSPGETTATRTKYSHDSRYRTTGVSKGSSSVGYSYSSDLLTAISSASGTNYSFVYGVFDLISSVKAGSRTLISHTYSNDTNRWLTRSDYGNGDYITYSYDSKGRISGIGYEDNASAIGYTYDNNGNLGILTDGITGRRTKYAYDFQDRLMRYEETGSDYSNTVQWGYDDKNNLSSQTQTLNDATYTTNYTYDNDNRLKQATTDGKSANYTYDVYSRMTGITAKSGTKSVVTTGITYTDPSTTTTSSQVYKWTVGGTTYTYTYDVRGNITAISDGSKTTTYVYDSLDQLIRENNQAAGKTWVYTYDNGGNILTKKEYSYTTGTLGTVLDTITYSYGDSLWKDLLTSYDGQALTTDAIGNLTDDGTWSYAWQHGRQLYEMSKSGTSVAFGYDFDGKRITKTVGDTTYSYHYLGSQLAEMSWNSNNLHFTYDEVGPMSVAYGGAEYFYLKNAQGDVTGLVDSSGTQVVAYTYDAWGNPLTTGTMANTLGELNPFRYRGYVYDTETGLYYLQSRYYNPQMGRFINADGELSDVGDSVKGYNLFSYCQNNPTNMSDSEGNWPKWTNKIVAAAAIVIAVTVIAAITVATAGAGSTIACVAVGAAKGALTGFVVGAITGAATNVVSNRVKSGSWSGSGKAALEGAGDGALSGTVSGLVTGGLTSRACFVAGTSVASAAGLVAIENVQAGDKVWSEDPDTGTKELKEVVRTFVNETDKLVHVTIEGETIDCTPEHPFYSPVKGWTEAIQLRAGDILCTVNGDYVVVEQVQHEILETPVQVFNFEVSDFHTYFVGTVPVLVHNTCGVKNTPDQNAVIQLAKSNKKGISMDDAETLVKWAQEYNLPGNPRIDLGHPGRGVISQAPHAHIGPVNHIPIFKVPKG